jgi:hypothetical protein
MLSPANADRQTQRRGIRALAAMTVVLVGAGLYTLGAQPFAVGLFPSPWDKLAHAMTFALVGAAAGLASGTRGWRMLACCIAGAVMIGVMDEWHQAYLPGRTASWADLGADAMGGLLGATLLSIRLLIHRRADRLREQLAKHR